MDLQDLNPPETYIRSKWVECPKCYGDPVEVFSDCCGEDAKDGYCTACREICETNEETCQRCEGEGQIEISEDDYYGA